jgi:hypothetical protein
MSSYRREGEAIREDAVFTGAMKYGRLMEVSELVVWEGG